MPRWGAWAAVVVVSATATIAAPVRAFCGFYAGSATSELTASASRVVLLREGTRTVLTMQTSYEGPPEHFALVVPVPVVLSSEDVRALEPEIFDRLDELTAPRVVEYEERPPTCPSAVRGRSVRVPTIRTGMAQTVTVEAEFTTAEYDVVILSATDSSALETWLRDHRYHVPEGAADALRPYVEAGTRFFVARVDVSRVRFEDGRAMLSPLRVTYEAPQLTLPVRLGVLNSRGTQDLIVYVLAQGRRFEVANRESLLAPTNVEVSPETIPRFASFYEALFDRTMQRHPDAVVSEYAWSAASCDPCPRPPLSAEDLTALGGDLTSAAHVERLGEAHVEVRVHRRSGRGSSEEGLREALARREAAVRSCIGGSLGDAIYELDASIDPRGRLDVPAAREARRGSLHRCVGRRLRGTLVDAPPLGVDRSEWTIELRVRRDLVRRVWGSAGFTLTRLRTRTRKDGRIDDLVFREAAPIVGGRDVPDAEGHLDREVRRGRGDSTFQSRFVVLHRTAERVACERPAHGGWTVPTRARAPARGRSATGRSVESLLRTAIEELDLRPAARDRGAPRRGQKRAGKHYR